MVVPTVKPELEPVEAKIAGVSASSVAADFGSTTIVPPVCTLLIVTVMVWLVPGIVMGGNATLVPELTVVVVTWELALTVKVS